VHEFLSSHEGIVSLRVGTNTWSTWIPDADARCVILRSVVEVVALPISVVDHLSFIAITVPLGPLHACMQTGILKCVVEARGTLIVLLRLLVVEVPSGWVQLESYAQ